MPYNEADTRAKLIDPAIHKNGWTEDLIRREETAGSIEIINGKARRIGRGKVDYTLRVKVNTESQPVALALIEAKKEDLPAGHGLTQAKAYATCKRLNVLFVFSSNGHLFVEFDKTTGITSQPKPMSEFPAPIELRTRYESVMKFTLDEPLAKPLLIPYKGGEGTRRYYQDAAIRAILEKIIRCEKTNQPKRALLPLATGSGKTFIAVNLLKRIADAGQLKKALFLCDRDELRRQGLSAFQNVFGSDAAEVFEDSTGRNNAKNARIHITTYQTLGIDSEEGDASFLTRHYPKENEFSHIVIDECHRSAWGKWSQVLLRNDKAVQIGLTATPRQLKITENTKEAEQDRQITADNLRHFGIPVYEYDMAQAMEDGYLAACQIQQGRVNLDDTGISIEEIIARNPVDAITGETISAEELRERYEKTQYEDKILLPDRVIAMCQDLFNYLIETGNPEQKTVIFCARDRHADDVAVAMNNLYANWCNKNKKERCETYAFKCTAASSGNDQLPDFKASTKNYFIATTVDLLTTGVDIPCLRNVVFFKYIKSPISFHQMVGRGTRIDINTDKLMFTVYDYTNATRLFGEEFITRRSTGGGGDGPPPPVEPVIKVEGFDVKVTNAGKLIVTQVDGKAMPIPLEEYKAQLAERLTKNIPTLIDFRKIWVDPPQRRDMVNDLVMAGFSPSVLRIVEDMTNFDLYDVLADLGYGLAPRTRRDRSLAFIYKNEDWLTAIPDRASKTVRAIAGQFELGGTESLENPHIFRVPAVVAAGGLKALREYGRPSEVLTETRQRMFAV